MALLACVLTRASQRNQSIYAKPQALEQLSAGSCGLLPANVCRTMDGEQGVEMMEVVQPKLSIPIHYDDYDVFKSPLSDFQRDVREAGLEGRVHYLSRGETYNFRMDNARQSN
jgi:L-ascorbate metabolism protein UlaG (beta-lactamase superfamily)